MAVSKSLRFQVLRRDNHTCRYCGRSAPEWPIRIDHVLPVALGGGDEPGNLVAACADCNAGKAATPPDAELVADVDADAIRWANAIKRAAELDRAEADAVRERADAFLEYWAQFQHRRLSLPVDDGWRTSVESFHKAGLVENDLLDAVDITMGKRGKVGAAHLWRYFCGVCWRKVQQRQEMAAEFLDAEDDVAIPAEPVGDAA